MIHDLTIPIHEGMTTYPRPWHPYVEVSQLGRHGIEGRETRKLVLGTHTGTHVDAPRHFIPDGETIDNIDLHNLYGRCSILNLVNTPNLSAATTEDVYRALNGRPADRVILRFDWDKYLGSNRYYEKHPFITLGAAQLLIDRGCVMIGMDTPMPDSPQSTDMAVHKRVLSQGAVLVEYLCNLKSLPTDEVFDIVVAPLKIVGGDGAPARVFAIA
jgi:arylformamidase